MKTYNPLNEKILEAMASKNKRHLSNNKNGGEEARRLAGMRSELDKTLIDSKVYKFISGRN
jgi:hypothetical protein